MIKKIALVGMIFYTGCNSPIPSKVEKIDTKEIHLTTIRWGSDDLQEIAHKVVSKILSSNSIDFSKTYSFGEIRNDSYDHIDTKHLANKITTALVQSGKIKMSENKNHQSEGIFYGKISSIFKKNNTTKDMFFNFNLSLSNVQTSEVVWSGDIEIRKVYKKALFGW